VQRVRSVGLKEVSKLVLRFPASWVTSYPGVFQFRSEAGHGAAGTTFAESMVFQVFFLTTTLVLLLFAFVGFVLSIPRPDTWMLSSVLVIATLAGALMNHPARDLLPYWPYFAAFATWGAWGFFRFLSPRSDQDRPSGASPPSRSGKNRPLPANPSLSPAVGADEGGTAPLWPDEPRQGNALEPILNPSRRKETLKKTPDEERDEGLE